MHLPPTGNRVGPGGCPTGHAGSTTKEAPISICPYLKGAVFDPDTIDVMAIAFDDTCKSLKVAPDAQIVREIIAKQVMELARRGERDPKKLHAEALKAMNLEQGR